MDNLPPLPPGFHQLTGKRCPRDKEARYYVQLRCGLIDRNHTYKAADLKWIWEGHAGDVVAIAPQK